MPHPNHENIENIFGTDYYWHINLSNKSLFRLFVHQHGSKTNKYSFLNVFFFLNQK